MERSTNGEFRMSASWGVEGYDAGKESSVGHPAEGRLTGCNGPTVVGNDVYRCT